MAEFTGNLRLFCTPEFEKAPVVLALVCVSAVIALFGYLGRTTGSRHFGMWAVSYLCYALYLAGTIAFGIVPENRIQATVLSAATGISALCMFWGNFCLADRSRQRRELALATAVM